MRIPQYIIRYALRPNKNKYDKSPFIIGYYRYYTTSLNDVATYDN